MFCTQDNQYVSPAVPGTAEKLNEILDSPRVKWKIETIRAVRKPGAIKQWDQAVGIERGIPEVLHQGSSEEESGRSFQRADGRREADKMGNSLEGVVATADFRSKGFR